MAAEGLSVSKEFDILAQKPVQSSVQENEETIYRRIASVEQSDFEFVIPAENENYVDLNIRLHVRGELTAPYGNDFGATDFIAVTYKFLHSLISQCSITLKWMTVTQTTDLYQ